MVKRKFEDLALFTFMCGSNLEVGGGGSREAESSLRRVTSPVSYHVSIMVHNSRTVFYNFVLLLKVMFIQITIIIL